MRKLVLGSLMGSVGLIAQAGFADTAAVPSFSCEAAESDAEKAICSDPQLAALDVELARLYGLAVSGPTMEDARLATLKATQRGWLKGRDDCWKEPDHFAGCLAAQYTMRIDELRSGYADARAQDDAGRSLGPLAYRCDGLDALVSLVLVQSDPQTISLRWRDVWVTATQTPAASGAKFIADGDSPTLFWMKGNTALFSPSGDAAVSCVQEDVG